MFSGLSQGGKFALRVCAYLLVAACSQPLLETYGCACAHRSYTAEEISGYRDAAAKDQLDGLREMQEYYMWRRGEQETGSPAYVREAREEEKYRQRRLALHDPDAIDEEIQRLIFSVVRGPKSVPERLSILKKAQSLVPFLRGDGVRMYDFIGQGEAPRELLVSDYLKREIAKLNSG